MGGFLILLSMVIGFVSFIGIIRPMRRLWLPTRKRAAVVWLASFPLFILGGALLPDRTPEEPAVREVGEQEVAQGEPEQEKTEREEREGEREDQEEGAVVSRDSVSLASVADTAAVPKAAVDSMGLDTGEPVVHVTQEQERQVAQQQTEQEKTERKVRERGRSDQEERAVVSRDSNSLASVGYTETVSEADTRSELQRRGIEFTESDFCLNANAGNLEIVQLFISAGMDINAHFSRTNITHKGIFENESGLAFALGCRWRPCTGRALSAGKWSRYKRSR